MCEKPIHIPKNAMHELFRDGPRPNDWAADFKNENGMYESICYSCREPFFGNKHRIVCYVCTFPRAAKVPQSKAESWLESICNNGSAFLISLALWSYVVRPLYDSQIVTESSFIVAMFTVVSLVRSYLWRRFFNARLHTLVHRWAKKCL